MTTRTEVAPRITWVFVSTSALAWGTAGRAAIDAGAPAFRGRRRPRRASGSCTPAAGTRAASPSAAKSGQELHGAILHNLPKARLRDAAALARAARWLGANPV